MSPTYQFLLFLHIVAALVWIGGLLFMALVGAPILRRVEPAPTRAALFRALGMRLRWVGWGALVVLLVTGTWILQLRGWLRADVLGDPGWWATSTGRALGWKLGAVGAMVVLALGHDLLEGRTAPADGSTVRGALLRPGSVSRRRVANFLARGSAVAALVLVYWAMRLARGG